MILKHFNYSKNVNCLEKKVKLGSNYICTYKCLLLKLYYLIDHN